MCTDVHSRLEENIFLIFYFLVGTHDVRVSKVKLFLKVNVLQNNMRPT